VVKYSLGLPSGQCKPFKPSRQADAEVPRGNIDNAPFRACRSMSNALQIVPYRPEFRERLVALWRASFAHGVGRPVPNPVDDHLRYFDEHVLVETHVKLALLDGDLAGFGAFTPESVMQLYVHVDHLGRGIGSRLLAHAKAASSGKLWLYTFVTNLAAQRFYERHGFEIVERGFEPVMQLGDLRYEWKRGAA
jgi:ribosomal protein S18 acetylase RimI-like enzyme